MTLKIDTIQNDEKKTIKLINMLSQDVVQMPERPRKYGYNQPVDENGKLERNMLHTTTMVKQ